MTIDKVSHVISQIATLSGRLHPIKKNNSIWIKCPFHGGGNENTPSCSVNTTGNSSPVGYYYCFACRGKGGSWDKLAAALGLAGFKAADKVNDVFSFAIQSSDEKQITIPKLKSMKPWPKGQTWRHIEPKTLRALETMIPYGTVYEDDFIYFPVHINKRYVGGIYARKVVSKKTKRQGLSSYLNTPGKWTKTALFGYNVAKKRKGPLWIVEGPRDTAKLVQLGGRVVGLCGAYVSEEKIRLIQALDPPCIIIATDPDEAGNKARKELKKKLSMFPIFEAQFPEGKDPANLTEKSYSKMLISMGLKKKPRK